MVRPSAKAVGIRLEFTTDIQHAAGVTRSDYRSAAAGGEFWSFMHPTPCDVSTGVARPVVPVEKSCPDLNPDPGDSPKTDSGMGPDPSGAAGKKLGRFGRVIQTPRRFCCHSKFWGGLCSEHWGERGRIPCGNTPTFSDSPDR
ncbi:hypothetical protein AAFF_G00330720 [Aldrovandia affinis]|uniref:Uncharacterized protein n=1 Tax=Aldrovandia affinis TaxID=143900 RepID=A0AAD7R6R9_9TELE|nr:hypothetical protein AAFF_G00330720 [Aldrovandia affinis]